MNEQPFTVGVRVRHATLGRGIVKEIVSRQVNGVACRFVCVLIERKKLTVQLPLDDPSTLAKMTVEPADTGSAAAAAAPAGPEPTAEPEPEPTAEPEPEQEPGFPDGASVRAFIREVSAEIDPTIPDDPDGFDAACVLWAGMVVGPYDQKVAAFLELEPERVRAFTNRLRGQGVWSGNTIRVDWEKDESGGTIAFLMDLGVAEGDFCRSEHDGKLMYRITRRGQTRERQRRRERGRRELARMQTWRLAGSVQRAGLRLSRVNRNDRRQANLARMLIALRRGPQPIAANAREIGVAYETANTLLKELAAAGIARRGSGLRHHGQYVLTNAGRRAAERLIENAAAPAAS